jgi:hypothetical protein
MASRCARQASYGLLGVDPVPPTPRESGRMARGRFAGEYVGRQMKAKYGEADVVLEMGIPWPAAPELPIGELHTDIVVLSERLAIEVKNSVWVDSMYESAVQQLAGALHFGRDKLDAGLLVFVDHDLQITHEFPVFLTDELVEQVEEIAAAVIAAGATGQVPERVCGKPADGRGHFCPFIEHCFSDWEAPPASERGDLSELASEGWVIQRDLKTARGSTKELEAQWEAWKEKAAEATEGQPPGLEIMAGPIRLKRIDVKGRETFSLAKARTAGVWGPGDEERFGAFTKIGEPSVRFDLTKTEAEAPLDIDYGDASHLDEF